MDYFSIDPASGLLTLAKPILRARLEAEGFPRNGSLGLVVRATDDGRPPQLGEAGVEVHVDEMNDAVPQFTRVSYMVSLQEEVPAGMV